MKLIYSEPGFDLYATSKEAEGILLNDIKRVKDGCNTIMSSQGPLITKFDTFGNEYSECFFYALGGQKIGKGVYSQVD